MKKLWARVSMEFEVTDEEYEELLEEAKGPYCSHSDVDIDAEFVLSHNAIPSEDSYIPGCVFDEMEEERK